MTRKLLSMLAVVALAGAPVAATTVERASQPAKQSADLGGGNTVFFVAGIALVAAAILLLPEEQDDPVSA